MMTYEYSPVHRYRLSDERTVSIFCPEGERSNFLQKLVTIYHYTRCNIPEVSRFYSHRRDNLQSFKT
jgi:hypothetical protein